MITITLRQIKDARPCTDGWRKILQAQGPDLDRQFPLADAAARVTMREKQAVKLAEILTAGEWVA